MTVTSADTDAILARLAEPAPPARGGFGERMRRHQAAFANVGADGRAPDRESLVAIAGVLRELHDTQRDHPLSFGERRYLDAARAILTRAIAEATSTTEADAAARVNEALG